MENQQTFQQLSQQLQQMQQLASQLNQQMSQMSSLITQISSRPSGSQTFTGQNLGQTMPFSSAGQQSFGGPSASGQFGYSGSAAGQSGFTGQAGISPSVGNWSNIPINTNQYRSASTGMSGSGQSTSSQTGFSQFGQSAQPTFNTNKDLNQ